MQHNSNQTPVVVVESINNYQTSTYPIWVGFIFIFNLIVGTGALTLPAAFAKAGWLLSLIVIILLAVISYITATFIIEVMAAANAVKTWQNLQILKRRHDFESREDDGLIQSEEQDMDVDDPTASLLPSENVRQHLQPITIYPQYSTLTYYKLEQKFELGEMATIFFNDFGRISFYLCICIYLFGDLSIYSAAISKSLCDILCAHSNVSINATFDTFNTIDMDNNETDSTTLCWPKHNLTRFNVYRLILICFTLLFGPIVMFSVQKTKYLQIFTAIFRWCAFIFMISIAIKLLINNGVKGHPPAINITGIPALFGACIYSFMCHHSLPSLLAPIREKNAISRLLCFDYALICSFYILLSMTGLFAFEHLQDLYTLNFIPETYSERNWRSELLLVIDYFLAIFPVVTLSASYPIIAITLRNNLQTLFVYTRLSSHNLFIRRILFPLMTVLPPFLITYFTESLTTLVAFTGSYAGAGIQYLIPIALVYNARNTCRELLGTGVINDYQSPFRSLCWLILILLWSVACLSLVSLNFALNTNI